MKASITFAAVALALFHAAAHAKFTTGNWYTSKTDVGFEWHNDKFAVLSYPEEAGLNLIFCKDAECKADVELKDDVSTKIATSDNQKKTKQWFMAKVDKEKGFIGHTDKFEEATEFTFAMSQEHDDGTFKFELKGKEGEAVDCCFETYNDKMGKVLNYRHSANTWKFTIKASK